MELGTVQVFEFKSRSGVEYAWLGELWVVKEIAKHIGVDMVAEEINLKDFGISKLEDLLRINPDINFEFSMTTENKDPIMAVLIEAVGGYEYVIIDGWHRLYKAVANGQETIMVYWITGELEVNIRVEK